MENSKRLNQQGRPGIESGFSYQPVLSTELLRHWWGILKRKIHCTVNYFSEIVALLLLYAQNEAKTMLHSYYTLIFVDFLLSTTTVLILHQEDRKHNHYEYVS